VCVVDKGRQSNKLYFRYKAVPRWDKHGNVSYHKKPTIEVIFRRFAEHKDVKNNREVKMLALIDSGADSSFIPLEVARTLRLKLDESDVTILTVAGETKVYQTKVYVEIPIKGKMSVTVGDVNAYVMPHESGKNMAQFVILGRIDFFEKFDVAISETNQSIVLRAAHKPQKRPFKSKKN